MEVAEFISWWWSPKGEERALDLKKEVAKLPRSGKPDRVGQAFWALPNSDRKEGNGSG